MKFICDKCGGIIENPREGMVEWVEVTVNDKLTVQDFKIVHNHYYSPYKSTREGCYHHEYHTGRADVPLSYFLENKEQYLASFLDLGFMHDSNNGVGCRVVDFKEYANFMRRLTIPNYEEARLHFRDALHDGVIGDENEICIFRPDTLERIIDEYK